MPTYRDRGIVLRTWAVRDADRRYTIFTEQHGKIVLLAKGSRKAKSKMAAHLTVFGVVDLMVAKGKLTDHLAGALLVKTARQSLGSLTKMTLMQSLLLTADAFTRRDQPEAALFSLLDEFIATVDAMPEPTGGARELVYASFITRLTDLLGFGLELDACVRCRERLEPAGNALNVIRGGVECRRCQDGIAPAVSPEAIKALRFLRAVEAKRIWRLAVPGPVVREVKFLTELQVATRLEGRLPALRYFAAMG
jgi:DNA repair protein RecO (recombination protein O)